jgi:hypothetical protein
MTPFPKTFDVIIEPIHIFRTRASIIEEAVKFIEIIVIHEHAFEELHNDTFTIISHVQTLCREPRITITEDNMI